MADRTPTRTPDQFARHVVLFGLVFCAALLACAIWPNPLLNRLLLTLDLPPVLWSPIRFGLAFMAGFGLLKGIASLVFWSSGDRVFRKLRF